MTCWPCRAAVGYRPVERDERDLQTAIKQVIGHFPTYGSRRVAHQLRREHSKFKVIGRKRVPRVLGEMGLKLRRKVIKKQTTDSRHCFPRYENLVKELDSTLGEKKVPASPRAAIPQSMLSSSTYGS